MMNNFEKSSFEVKSTISNKSKDITFPSYIGERNDNNTIFFPSAIGESDLEKMQYEKLKIQYCKGYLDELKDNSEYPETITNKLIDPESLERRSTEENKELRIQFNNEKDNLIAQWEIENGMKWPCYNQDIYNKYGEIVKKKGWKYDAHHIIPLSLGGNNTADNITPLSYDVHSEHKGVHATGSYYDKLDQLIKEK